MIPDKTVEVLEKFVESLSVEDCGKVYINNEGIFRYRYHDERYGQYIFNMIFHGMEVSLPELFYETDDKMANEIYTHVLFAIYDKRDSSEKVSDVISSVNEQRLFGNNSLRWGG